MSPKSAKKDLINAKTKKNGMQGIDMKKMVY